MEEGMNFELEVVCTDHHEHNPRSLAGLVVGDDGAVSERGHRTTGRPVGGTRAIVVADSHFDAEHGNWRFTCPTCRRVPLLTDEKLRRIAAGYRAAGYRVLDISLLPN